MEIEVEDIADEMTLYQDCPNATSPEEQQAQLMPAQLKHKCHTESQGSSNDLFTWQSKAQSFVIGTTG